jgi:hypothetical protein
MQVNIAVRAKSQTVLLTPQKKGNGPFANIRESTTLRLVMNSKIAMLTPARNMKKEFQPKRSVIEMRNRVSNEK